MQPIALCMTWPHVLAALWIPTEDKHLVFRRYLAYDQVAKLSAIGPKIWCFWAAKFFDRGTPKCRTQFYERGSPFFIADFGGDLPNDVRVQAAKKLMKWTETSAAKHNGCRPISWRAAIIIYRALQVLGKAANSTNNVNILIILSYNVHAE